MPKTYSVVNNQSIDPPVTLFSPPHEIKAWVTELQAIKNPSQGDREALNYAREWLIFAECRERYHPKSIH